MNEPVGLFVTLRKRGELRGCIGNLAGRDVPHLAVEELAVAAATRDPRFDPVEPNELPEIRIELSILSPLTRIRGPDEIRIGTHGLCVMRGRRRGVYLPQVAVECAWDVPTFLAETCRKAGLAPAAWKERDTELFVFETQKAAEVEERA